MAIETTTSFKVEIASDVLEFYSGQMLYYALPLLKFMEFTNIRGDFMAQAGDTVKFIRWDNLTGSPVYVENADITTDNMTGDTVSIVLSEWLKALGFSEKLLLTAPTDLLEEAAKALAKHWTEWGPERLLRDTAMINAGSVIYAGAATSRATIVSTDVLTTTEIKDATEALATANAPRFQRDGDEFYVCFVHPHQARALKDDPDWVSVNNYHQTRNIFSGELGRFDNVVFIESSAMPRGGVTATSSAFYNAASLSASGTNDLTAAVHGGAVDVYLAVVFGDSYLALATMGDPEMRDNGVENLGTRHILGWYQLYGANVLFADYGVRIETA